MGTKDSLAFVCAISSKRWTCVGQIAGTGRGICREELAGRIAIGAGGGNDFGIAEPAAACSELHIRGGRDRRRWWCNGDYGGFDRNSLRHFGV